MEKLLEAFVIALQAAQQDAVIIRQGKKGAAYPTGGHDHAAARYGT